LLSAILGLGEMIMGLEGEGEEHEEMIDFFEFLLAFDVRFELLGAESLLDIFFLSVVIVGELAGPEGPEEDDESDVRTILIAEAEPFSVAPEKRKPGVRMSCFEMRRGRELFLEIRRGLVAWTVSTRVLEALNSG
jgi:hypothetical protein